MKKGLNYIDKFNDENIEVKNYAINEFSDLKNDITNLRNQFLEQSVDLVKNYVNKHSNLEGVLPPKIDKLNLIKNLSDPDFIDSSLHIRDLLFIHDRLNNEFFEDFDSIELNGDNRLDEDYYLINQELEHLLNKGWNIQRKNLDTKFFYVVVFNVLKNKKDNKNVLVYNYIEYNSIFLECFISYVILEHMSTLIHKQYSIGSNYFFLLEENLKGNSLLNRDWVMSIFDELESIRDNHIVSINILDFYKLIVKGMIDPLSLSNICHILKLVYTNKFSELTNMLFCLSKDRIYEKDITNYINVLNKKYVFNYLTKFIFIVPSLSDLVDSLKNLGFTDINAGPQKHRGSVSYINSILCRLDLSFRNSMYNHNRHFVSKGNANYIDKTKFSFRNIHINLGNVKWYSSFTRQNLFNDNYKLIFNVLEDNYFIGSKEVQEKIENLLYNQENIYLKKNNNKNLLNYNDKNFEFLLDKKKELCKLLDYPEENISNLKIFSAKYIPLIRNMIKELSVESVSELLLSYFLNVITSVYEFNLDNKENTFGVPVIKIYDEFGKKILNHYIYSMYKKSDIYKNNGSFSEFENSMKENIPNVYRDSNSYAMIGGHFIWCLVTINLLIQVLDKHTENTQEKTHYFRLSDSVINILIKDNIKIHHLPQRLPMVCEPKDWYYEENTKKNKLGGFLLNDIKYSDSLIRHKVNIGEKTKLKSNNIIIPMVNNLQKVPYKINTDTLNYIYKYGIEKNIIIDDSNYKDLLKNPYKSSKKDFLISRSIVSKIIQQKNVLNIADLYSNVDKIFFPIKLDFRLRIYCNTDYFGYQHNDLAKGLISFYTPGKILRSNEIAIMFFKAYGANMFGHGLNKKSLNYRVKWIDDNTNKILNFQFNDIVKQAENKVSFVSFCFEYKRFVEFWNSIDLVVFNTYLPIELDASCNGYQHLALLTKEINLLPQLNLDISTFEDDPNDFYSYVNNNTISYIKESISNLENSRNDIEQTRLSSLKKLDKIKLGREILKLIIMRESYSAGVPKLVDNILSHENITQHGKGSSIFYTYLDYETKFSRKDFFIYVSCIKKVLSTLAPNIKKLSHYLNRIVYICTCLSLPIPWILPSGAEIPQSYMAHETKTVQAFSFTKSKYTFKKFIPGRYNLYDQKKAIRPNLIHSLDATTIAKLYNKLSILFESNLNIYTIHDCFAVTADNIDTLINEVKLVYINLYSSENYLFNFDLMVKLSINKTYGDDVYKLGNKFVNIPNKSYTDNLNTIEFPDIGEIIKLEKNKFKKISFPDISIITQNNVKLNNLKESSYPII